MAAVLTFDVAAFRVLYPAFSDVNKYPDATLEAYWDMATCFVSPANFGVLAGHCRQQALNLCTAHMTTLGYNAAAGQATGITTGAGVGAVNVTNLAPPVKSQFQYWLYLTPYGAQLAALLGLKGTGGIYVGGLPEKSAFRKVGGVFF